MRVMGIDPGLGTTGYAVLESSRGRPRVLVAGALRTSAREAQGPRLARLRLELGALLHAHRPQVAAVERLFFNANVRTAMAVGQAAGVALATAAEGGVEVASYTPTEVKLAVVGVGGATKAQVASMVVRLAGLERTPTPPDAADACALALCHLSRARLAAAVGRAGR
jgi:crossover junction endodeoxyribonuclease RuvC